MTELDRHSVYCLHRCKVIDRLISWLSHVPTEEGSIERGARVMGELDRHCVYSRHGCKVIQRLVSWQSHVSAKEGVKLKERGARITRELERRHSVTYVHGCKATDRLVQSPGCCCTCQPRTALFSEVHLSRGNLTDTV